MSKSKINPRIVSDKRLSFRKSFESVNMGVVPTDPEQLVNLTIRGEEVSEEIRDILKKAPRKGACRNYLGYYGSGKSHHLQLVRSIALQEGWVTASVELNPKSADPAKASTVYRSIISGLEFPDRKTGPKNVDFFDLIEEIRENLREIRTSKYFKHSPWFSNSLMVFSKTAHRREDQIYKSGVDWLGGQVNLVSAIKDLARHVGYKDFIPKMPQIKDNGLIYAFHLVVLNHILKILGYNGLAIIIDEAEHVRNYNIIRYLRANNFFDVLARCAHPPTSDRQDPLCDFDISELPEFWNEGPHFALFVGLTEGEDTIDLKQKEGELSVLFYSPQEIVYLDPPDADDYEDWAFNFIIESSKYLGKKTSLLAEKSYAQELAEILRIQFEETEESEIVLRNWTKLAGFPASVLLSQPEKLSIRRLSKIVKTAALEISGDRKPWDD